MSRRSNDDDNGGGGGGNNKAYGHFPEADVFPSNNQQHESKICIDDYFTDSSWIELDNNTVEKLFYRFDHDATLKTITNIYQSTLFSGGVMFTRPNKKMKPEATRHYDSTWSHFGRMIDRSQAVIGFCACSSIPHSEYIGSPVCLELSKCTTLCKTDVLGNSHFVFFENIDPVENASFSLARRNIRKGGGTVGGASSGPMSELYKYIPNVVVYCETPPDIYGGIRSKVNVLSQDLELTDVLVHATIQATISRSNPPLVLETLTQPHDETAIINTINPSSMMLGNGDEPYSSSSSSSSIYPTKNTRSDQEMLERKRFEYSQQLSRIGVGGMERADSLARMHMRQNAADPNGLKEYCVSDGKKLVKQTLAEGPGDMLIKFRLISTERVLNLYGIPVSMIFNTSSLGKTSMDENSLLMFNNTQKQKKSQLLGYFYDMYDRIYLKHHTLHKLADTPASELNPESNEKTDVSIIMSGLPSEDMLTQLYTIGALKYDSFVKYTSSKYFIPIEDFNTECAVSLDDLNGVKKEAPAATPAKKKAKTVK